MLPSVLTPCPIACQHVAAASGWGIRVGGPYFDDLSKAASDCAGVTLSLGLAAAHQSIVVIGYAWPGPDLCGGDGYAGSLAHWAWFAMYDRPVNFGDSASKPTKMIAGSGSSISAVGDTLHLVPRWWGCEPLSSNWAVRQPDWRGCG